MAVDRQKAGYIKGVLREKSEDTGIPLKSLLKNHAYNVIAKRFKAEDNDNKYLLINPKALVLSKEDSVQCLNYAYLGDCIKDKSKISIDLKHFLQWDNEGEIGFKFATEQQDNTLFVFADATLEDYTVTVKIKISSSLFIGSQGEEQLINGETYLCYPAEKRLADLGIILLERLELIEDMSIYEEAYKLLTEADITARSMTRTLMEKAEASGLKKDVRRIEKLRSYEGSPYMKKRWKSYINKKKSSKGFEHSDWKAVSTLCNDFYEPLWIACCDDTVYLGDWMPALGRWL